MPLQQQRSEWADGRAGEQAGAAVRPAEARFETICTNTCT